MKGGTGLSLIEVTSSGREGSSVRNCSGAGSRNFAVFRGVDMNSGPWPGCYGFEIGRCPLTGGICCISLVHNFIYILSMAWKVELLEKKLLILLHWLSPLAPRHRSRLSYMQLRHLIKGLDKCQVKVSMLLSSTPACAYEGGVSVAGLRIISPCSSRAFLSHPVLNSGSILKRGKGCASVLMTTWSSGNTSSGPNSR